MLAAAQAAVPFVHPGQSQRGVRISTELGRKSDADAASSCAVKSRCWLERTYLRRLDEIGGGKQSGAA